MSATILMHYHRRTTDTYIFLILLQILHSDVLVSTDMAAVCGECVDRRGRCSDMDGTGQLSDAEQ